MRPYLAHIYFILGGLELIGEVLRTQFEIEILYWITKPLLMLALIAYFISENKDKNTLSKIMIAGIAFAWLGDVLLMFVNINANFFMGGIVAFLLTHVLYIYLFSKNDNGKKVKSILLKRPLLIVPWLFYAFAFVSFMMNEGNETFKEMMVPVFVYAGIILIMVIASLNRYGRVSKQSFIMVCLGAILFLFSDTLIAANSFTNYFAEYTLPLRVGIMTLYIIAQFLIVDGYLKKDDAEARKVL